jgi:hypothetical protein
MKKTVITIPEMEINHDSDKISEIVEGCDFDKLHDAVASFIQISGSCHSHSEAMEAFVSHMEGTMTPEMVAALALIIGYGCKAIRAESAIKQMQESGELPEEIQEAIANGSATVIGVERGGSGGNHSSGNGTVH